VQPWARTVIRPDIGMRADRFDEDAIVRTCAHCGCQTAPHWSLAASLEDARRMGWRRVPASTRPGAHRIDLCGPCAQTAGYGPPLATRHRW